MAKKAYKLIYRPKAQKDMREIIFYISQELRDPAAATKLADNIVEAVDKLIDYPYAYPPYIPLAPLKHEYRKLIVQNYVVFYWVDERRKRILIERVLYMRRDYGALL